MFRSKPRSDHRLVAVKKGDHLMDVTISFPLDNPQPARTDGTVSVRIYIDDRDTLRAEIVDYFPYDGGAK